MSDNSTSILDVKVNIGLNMLDVLSKAIHYIDSDNCHYISTTNAEFIMDAQDDLLFKKIINEADLSIPDGVGILYAAHYLDTVKRFKKGTFFPLKAFVYGSWFGFSSLFKKYDLGNRISGVDLVFELCNLSQEEQFSIFLLGGWPKDFFGRRKEGDYNLAKDAAEQLRKMYPKANIIGHTSQFSPLIKDDKSTLKYLKICMEKANVSYLDVIFVAYGHPSQEKWIVRNISKIPARLGIGVGGTFDYIVGTKKRSPSLFIDRNLEWLYKIFTQPWRLKRISKAFPLFPIHIYLESLKYNK